MGLEKRCTLQEKYNELEPLQAFFFQKVLALFFIKQDWESISCVITNRTLLEFASMRACLVAGN